MTNNEEYQKRQAEISDTIKFGKWCAIIGIGFVVWSFFSKNNIQLLTVLFILSVMTMLALYGYVKTELEKLSKYISELKSREEYLIGELRNMNKVSKKGKKE